MRVRDSLGLGRRILQLHAFLCFPLAAQKAWTKLGDRVWKAVDAVAQRGIEVSKKCGEWKGALAA